MKVHNTLDVKEDLFCEEELATVLKGLEIIRLQVLILWWMSYLNMGAHLKHPEIIYVVKQKTIDCKEYWNHTKQPEIYQVEENKDQLLKGALVHTTLLKQKTKIILHIRISSKEQKQL